MAATLTTLTMPVTTESPEIVLRSPDAAWNEARWQDLPADGNRYEVIDGVLYVTTAPSSFHQWTVQALYLRLHAQLQETGWGLVFLAPIGLFMPGCDPVQPDLLVIRAADRHVFQGGRIRGVPALIVEVESPINVALDNRIKRAAYARAGVPEYWIARPARREVLLDAQPDTDGGTFTHSRLFGGDDDLVSQTLPVRFRVADLFAGAPDTSL